MKNHRLNFGWAAAALALCSCGETGSEPPAPTPAAGGLTIELPEPKAPPAPPPEPVLVPVSKQQKPDAKPEEAKKEPPPIAEPSPKAPEPEAPRADTPAPEAPAKAETPPAGDDSSPLPLPRPVVARTIERIGYSCGGVASSTRLEAPAGETAYRITCTSGDSYRASNRSGRFRFRKWGDTRN